MTHPGTAVRISATIMLLTSTALFAQQAEEDTLIEAQALGPALQALAEEYDLQLLYETALVASLSAQAIPRGASSETALNELLEGTNLTYQFVNGRTVTIQEKESSKEQESGKSRPASNQILIAQAETPAQQSQTRATAATDSGAEKTETGSNTIEEVIVSARKRDENLQDVPISIDAFSAEDLNDKSLTSLKELGQFVPNFNFSNHPSLGSQGALVYIRGIGQADPSNHLDPGVGVYIDNVYIGRMQGFDFDLMDLERVEILRGPQGTLFGKNTIGGAVNIITARPDKEEFAATAEITTGRFSRIDGKAIINIPLIPGKLAAKFAGATRNRGGYGQRLDFATGDKISESGDKQRLSGRAVFDWTATDSVDVLLSLDAARTRETGPVYKIVDFAESGLIALYNRFVDPDYGDVFMTDSEFATYGTGGNANDLDTWGIALNIDWDLGPVAVKSITSYRNMEALAAADLDGSPHLLFDSAFSIDQDQVTQEFQLSGLAFNERMNWLTGVYYFKEDSLQDGRRDIVRELVDPIGLDISFTGRVSSTVESYAVFGEGTYDTSEKFSIITGLRYTSETKDITRMRFNHFTGQVTLPADSRSESWDAFSGRFGFEYRWNDDVMTYFTVSRGFRSGGINARSSGPSSFVPFDPEYIWTYETGVKSDFLDHRLRFNSSIYYSDYSDLQFSVAVIDPETNTPISIVGNAAQAKIQGFELELTALPVEELILTAGVGYTDARYTDVEPTAPITKDDKFPMTPKWSITLSGQYGIPLGDLGKLIGRLDYAYKTKIYYQPVNDPLSTQESYGFLNGRLTLAHSGGDWDISLFGTNLTNKKYIITGLDGRAIGFALVQYAPPREWGLSFRYFF